MAKEEERLPIGAKEQRERLFPGMSAGQLAAMAARDGGAREDAERYFVHPVNVRQALKIQRTAPEAFARLLRGEIKGIGAAEVEAKAVSLGDAVGVEQIPALCDQAIRHLNEARDIGAVQEIRDQGEAMLAYVKKKDAAVHAQNRCMEVVKLAERRIGEELGKAKKQGSVAKRGDNLRQGPEVPKDDFGKATLSDLRLTKTQAAEYQELASVPPAVITETIEKATARDKPATKAAIKRAVKEAAPPKKPRAPRKKKEVEERGETLPVVRLVHDAERNLCGQFCHLINRLREIAEKIEPTMLRARMPEEFLVNLRVSLQPARDFLDAAWHEHARLDAREKAAAGAAAIVNHE
jgi:hypothetical protein